MMKGEKVKSIGLILMLILLTAGFAAVRAEDGLDEEVEPVFTCGSPQFHDETLKLEALYGHAESMTFPMPSGPFPAKPDVVGDVVTFWCYNFRTEDDYQLTATCQRVGTHCYIYVENGKVLGDAILNNIMDRFDNTIYPTDTDTFGSEWNPGIDNDERITILLLDIQDDYHWLLNPGFVGGYFHSRNEYTAVPGTMTEHSNEREMFYVDVDPGSPGSTDFLGTVAHEFQHVIHWYQDFDELEWVDEGCADYARFVCDYGHPQSHVNSFSNNPDTSLTEWDGTLADYGGSYLWTLYLSEKFGDLSGTGGHEQFIKDLVANDTNGITGVNDVLSDHGYAERFVDAFETWAIANYFDNSTIDSKYEYQNIDVNVQRSWDNWWHPLVPVGGQPYTISDPSPVNAWAADYIRVHFLSLGFYLKTTFDGNDTSSFVVYAIHNDNMYPCAISLDDSTGSLYIEVPQWATAVDYAIIRTETAGNGAYEVAVVEVEDQEYSKGIALQWLRDHQNENGSWMNDVGVTAMATLAFLNHGFGEGDPNIGKGVQYILGNVQPNGSITNGGLETYHTSLAILPLVATHNATYHGTIANAKDFLLDVQNVPPNVDINIDNPVYGGWGYGSWSLGAWSNLSNAQFAPLGLAPAYGKPEIDSPDYWSDLSNTQFALMGLAAAYGELGLSLPDYLTPGTWTNAAVRFLERVQNRMATNDQPWAGNDGGFTYHPSGWGPGGVDSNSYGSMTAAGVWSLRLCGVPGGDTRVQDALAWLLTHEDTSFSGNPNAYDPRAYQYYYYMSIAKALAMCYVDKIDGIDWYEALVNKLETLQDPAGFWQNDPGVGHGMEFEPEVATCFSLLALQTKQPIEPDLWMSIILASNADLHIYDPQGRHLGMNYQTGQMENEIPGATFTIDVEGRQIVELPELEAGHYRIELVGTSDGDYSLTVTGYRNEDVITSDTVNGTIGDDDTHVVDVVVSSLIGSLTVFVEDPEIVPSRLIAIPGEESVQLSWYPYEAPDFSLAGYNVYRSITSGTGYVKINTDLVTSPAYYDTGLTNGVTYYYVVTAVDTSDNETSHSREVSVTPTSGYFDLEYSTQEVMETAGWICGGLWHLTCEADCQAFAPNPTPFPSSTHAAHFCGTSGTYAGPASLPMGSLSPKQRTQHAQASPMAGQAKSYGELITPEIHVTAQTQVDLRFEPPRDCRRL